MEPVGLSVGVLGLAGLFTSCIDCFNLVQRGRYLGRDYLILETKYTNQRLRLLTWGQACGLTSPSDSNSGHPRWDENVHSAVSDTLLRIRSLFQDHSTLRRRYGLMVDQSSADGSVHVSAPSRLRSTLTSKFRATTFAVADLTQSALAGPSRSFLPKRRSFPAAVRWAVDDNRKFSELVQHLKDFIDDLEALTVHVELHAHQRQRELIEVEVASISDLSELETMEEARMGAIDAVADAASLRLSQIYNLDIQLNMAEPAAEPDMVVGAKLTLAESSPVSADSDESEWDMVEPSIAPATDPSDMYYQVLHRVACDAHSTMIFLDTPNYHDGTGREPDRQWLVIDENAPLRDPAPLHLAGQRPLPSLRAYLEQNTHLAFLVIREYKCFHDTDRPRQSQPTQTCIHLTSDSLCAVLNSWPLSARPPTFYRGMELRSPHTWLYHNRELLAGPLPPILVGQRPLTRPLAAAETLLEVIKVHTTELYNGLDESLDGHECVSWDRLQLIFRPGDIVVQRLPDGDDDFRAFEQTGAPRVSLTAEDVPAEVLEIPVARVFSPDGRRRSLLEPQVLSVRRSLFEGDGEVAALSALPIVPLRLAHDCDEGYLINRGRKAFEMTRGLSLVVYQDQDSDPLSGEYIIDVPLFEKQLNGPRKTITSRKEGDAQPEGRDDLLDDFDRIARPQPDESPEEKNPTDASSSEVRTYMCMPHTLPGFNTRHHLWKKLLVRNIEHESLVHTDVEDAQAKVDSMLMPEVIKDSLAKLLGPMELRPNWRWHRRRQLAGSKPPSAKIPIAIQGEHLECAARVVSRMTKRPLYRIRLSGHNQDLDLIFEKAKTLNADWGCIFLIEDFLEAYTSHNQASSRINRVVLPVLRFLDSFTGIAVFLLASEGPGSNTLRYVEPRIMQKLCNSFDAGYQNIPEPVREELWKECMMGRLGSTDGFLAGDVPQRLKELARFKLSWDAISSTVHAVLPKGVSPDAVDWSLLRELSEEQEKFKDPRANDHF